MEAPDRGLRLIALFKFTKATLLIALATNSDRPLVQQLVAGAAGILPQQLQVVALGAFLYAALFATEGVGLWLRQRWAEYLTAVATASLVPLEIYEVVHHFTLLRLGALALNIAVVAYLILRLRRAPRRGWTRWPPHTAAGTAEAARPPRPCARSRS